MGDSNLRQHASITCFLHCVVHEGVAVGTYKHYVHVYSDDLTFALCKATAELYNGDAKVSTIQSPSGNHHYWDTFTIDTAKRRFHAVNRLRQ